LHKGIKIVTFEIWNEMKYSELHRIIVKNGWQFSHSQGSHYFYKRQGVLSPPVPFHGAKEIGEGLRKKIIKEMNI
jgi:predicted RNA binding protein YcfA (HicA-like mRNA interferase family)